MYHSFFIHSSVSGHLGCFCVLLLLVNSTVVNFGVHVFFSVMVFSGYRPSSAIIGSYSSFIPSFLRNLHTVFHSSCYQFTFPPTVQEGPLFSTPFPAFVVLGFFDDGHSDQCEVISHCRLICISLIMNDVEHLF